MDIERERGITIKAQTVRLAYTARDGQTYELNLVDTPGHVDFSYEVSRSLRACEGSLLLVDATQGVEAQTLANAYQAIDADHEVIPVLNKIDLPAAEPERIKQQIEDIVGLPADDALLISAKTGAGIDDVLEAIVARLPAPQGQLDAPLKALVVDSWYDAYLGVVTLVRVKDGALARGQRVRMMGTGAVHQLDQVGAFTPKRQAVDRLGPGEIGFITASIKDLADARVGDTITDDRRPAAAPLPGFRPSQPVVFCGMFPVDAADFEDLRESLGKLRLNDASFEYEPENSSALGSGFRCGFLGLLHLEIIRERLMREFDLDLVITAPSVVYRVHLTRGEMLELHNPADMPDPTAIRSIEEPWIRATILVPDEHLGAVLALCTEKRGEQVDLTYAGSRALLVYRLPLNEVVYDFLRPPEVLFARLCQLRLSPRRLCRERPDQAPGPDQRRSGRFAGPDRAPLDGRGARPGAVHAAEGADPAADVPGRDPGGDRRPHRRPRDREALPQGRDRQVLWRRRHPQAQALGETEGRQEADAPDRQDRDPAGGLPRGAQDGGLKRFRDQKGTQPPYAR